MIQGSLARRYARAFVELAKETAALEGARSDLQTFSEVLKISPELFQTLCNRTISQNERAAILTAILGKLSLSSLSKPFLLLLLEKERMNIFDDVLRESLAAIDEEKGVLHAEIKSAVKLSDEVKKQLSERFSQALGKKVDLNCEEDPTLISGVWARIGHTIFDGSVTTQLEMLKQKVLQRNKHA